MLKQLFDKGPTSKFDVTVAVGTAIFAIFGAIETIKEYRHDQQNKENNA